ncbi:adenylosuccinate lyase [Candidatus Desantisbacteria bacterium CG2_30_40_21]|uniref:Adenylosuccinate lyase n=5 Tax=unclassified Candidatus Desantisiibacteriota TaxID=3106372 RepID=A0A2M7JDE1_9BACT|nr:MAG: adenylosuccinate lyase [Candidatus Desantisbacteria bacterium CG2_30_40_21]PIP40546.1 MAG: adenylosuccinate lyase [Candidatus Desantisbacteria bacterium CG23_combo_of_CG06-09_8_20_14_all_40_23]PIX17411.1 MAG: adenylosuccinate lyase [Candidatus Desantisbacteria bacterium CG_4_8_14_3_um_filter_40_12]PIY18582.1 MAG: adenylosuccinate lyase [Candidatus Desantisbacteria bacterium CG_4_10_14_3_um_filter_40_18]PJB29631.1 MAG: adenylosuccinate lyase [Candidatus Desantisbacteria bacterium CG_4_9_
MIQRYTRSEMGKIWTDEYKFRKLLEIEILACEAQVALGNIPKYAVEKIREKANFNVDRILEIEETVQHDIIAFLTSVAEYVGEESRYIHLGLTSYDVVDTCLSVRMRDAGEMIAGDLKRLSEVLKKQAHKYQHTIMIGRTHGIHAEPMTFGLKMALWYFETLRNIHRMEEAIKVISVGKLSGAVGTYSQIDPFVEEYVCQKLGLKQAEVATQVLQRDRHAEYLTTLAVIASSLEKFSTEIRNLQRTDIGEVEEPFGKGQKGSSAMPHKKNPVVAERISGLARVVRANAMAALENVSLWHERDIAHSSVERVIIPDSILLIDYMLDKFIWIAENIVVREDRMKENINRTKGLIHSQSLLLALTQKNVLREDAYSMVQRNAMRVIDEGIDFRELILNDQDIRGYLSLQEIDDCFDLDKYLKNIDVVFKRL